MAAIAASAVLAASCLAMLFVWTSNRALLTRGRLSRFGGWFVRPVYLHGVEWQIQVVLITVAVASVLFAVSLMGMLMLL